MVYKIIYYSSGGNQLVTFITSKVPAFLAVHLKCAVALSVQPVITNLGESVTYIHECLKTSFDDLLLLGKLGCYLKF